MVHLRKEAKLQGVDSVKIWACNQGCYDKLFVEQGGADVDGTYVVSLLAAVLPRVQAEPDVEGAGRSRSAMSTR